MESNILSRLAVLASADLNGGGLRDALFCLTGSHGEYRTGCWVICLDEPRPSLHSILHELHAVPPARRNIEHLYVHMVFPPHDHTEPIENSLWDRIHQEESAVADLRALLLLVAPSLRTLMLVRTSIHPFRTSLATSTVLQGLEFPVLEELAIQGPPQTTSHLRLPITPSFAPALRRLQLPSDALDESLTREVRVSFPRLTHVSINPLRPLYTLTQLSTILRLGELIGILRPRTPHEPDRTAVRPSESCLQVVAYVCRGALSERELRLFIDNMTSKVEPGLCDRLKIVAVQQREPDYGRMEGAREDFLARRLVHLLR
jgi:hypothetical protein